MTRSLLCTIVIALCTTASSNAQSLANLAKQEEARRRTITQPSRVYTNADLKPAAVSDSAAPAVPSDNAPAGIEEANSPHADSCADCAREANGIISRSDAAKKQFWSLTGFPNGRPGWEVDHIIPLACGGSDAPSNMRWQTRTASATKNRGQRETCPRDYETSIPVVSQPVLVLPGRTCGVNSPREQAMANAVAGGLSSSGPGQPCEAPENQQR